MRDRKEQALSGTQWIGERLDLSARIRSHSDWHIGGTIVLRKCNSRRTHLWDYLFVRRGVCRDRTNRLFGRPSAISKGKPCHAKGNLEHVVQQGMNE